jgi:glucose/arabinose dehydrogenase
MMPLQRSFVAAVFAAATAHAATAQFTTTQIATGLARPLYVVTAPGDTSRLFIVEQRTSTTALGRIRIFRNNALVSTPFLQINTAAADEQGLLGLAFHPDFASNGKFYINYSNVTTGATEIDEYTVSTTNPDVANTASRRRILSFSQPANNHNGGWMAFGPDGMLYIASGDGGGANDNAGAGNNALNLGLLLGKMLRIDVNGDDFPSDANLNYAIPPSNPFVGTPNVRGEIWSYGLRNPWRSSFDRLTGELYIADVGQTVKEEVNRQPAGVGGQNWGWRCWEGTRYTGLGGCTTSSTNTPPLFEYEHDFDIAPLNARGCSITGGYVYRGCRIPSLYGKYLVADYCSGWIYAVDPTPPITAASATLVANVGFGVTSFGEDANGEIYITIRGTGSNGRVLRLDPTTPGNTCCPADYNRDRFLNLDDLGDYITDYYTTPAIPSSLQPGAPTLNGIIAGLGGPCALAPDAAAPYAPDAFRRLGFRVGFSADGSNECPLDPSQNFPNLDNLNDFITEYYARVGTPGC